MKRLVSAVLAAVLAIPALASANVTVKLFSGFTEAGGDITFSGLTGTYVSNGLAFGDFAPGRNGFPGADTVFGAELTGFLQVDTAGSYTVTLGSDDASYLFLDGVATLALPGNHGYYTESTTVNLAAGLTPFRVAYQNTFCCGSQLTLETTARVAPVPEPGTYALMGAGLALVGAGVASRRRSVAA
ncbi:MAG: PEP-CTERM sorting domain-containing protein [Burkholderiales bacterium]|jgi:hypothetical protein|nr:PEP-CTERM sorting domain-containing protein [Burkholderiales bacterium]